MGATTLPSPRRAVRRIIDILGRCWRSAQLLPTALLRFSRLSMAERRTTLYATGVLLVVEVLVRWVKLPRLASLLGITFQPQPSSTPFTPDGSAAQHESTVDADLSEPVAMARRCTDRLMTIYPFGAGPCLRESLVLGYLLRGRGPTLRVGIARHGSRVRAHAWVEIDGRAINDPQGFRAFGS